MTMMMMVINYASNVDEGMKMWIINAYDDKTVLSTTKVTTMMMMTVVLVTSSNTVTFTCNVLFSSDIRGKLPRWTVCLSLHVRERDILRMYETWNQMVVCHYVQL